MICKVNVKKFQVSRIQSSSGNFAHAYRHMCTLLISLTNLSNPANYGVLHAWFPDFYSKYVLYLVQLFRNRYLNELHNSSFR